ncbi:hypothetical protein Btru_022595 [Bulinus truncatus]|nr:hypothetical protein Btru_022595 [Bulinus truncatus]
MDKSQLRSAIMDEIMTFHQPKQRCSASTHVYVPHLKLKRRRVEKLMVSSSVVQKHFPWMSWTSVKSLPRLCGHWQAAGVLVRHRDVSAQSSDGRAMDTQLSVSQVISEVRSGTREKDSKASARERGGTISEDTKARVKQALMNATSRKQRAGNNQESTITLSTQDMELLRQARMQMRGSAGGQVPHPGPAGTRPRLQAPPVASPPVQMCPLNKVARSRWDKPRHILAKMTSAATLTLSTAPTLAANQLSGTVLIPLEANKSFADYFYSCVAIPSVVNPGKIEIKKSSRRRFDTTGCWHASNSAKICACHPNENQNITCAKCAA